MQSSRTFRIFVSSTFSDLKAERNALQEKVFPRLRDLANAHGCRFQVIDLRWGVSEEASLDQQAMNICLGEIERCQQTSPRPNFIVLLGDRYGWRPLPSQIPALEFVSIEQQVSHSNDAALLKEWYQRDDNAVPPEYCLQPRKVNVPEDVTEAQKMVAHEQESAAWAKTETRLRSALLRGISQLGWPTEDLRRIKYEASATEQEIARGALQVENAREHVFCFFRNFKDLPQDASAKDFVDLDRNNKLDDDAHAKLDKLKAKLRDALPENIKDYDAAWIDNRITSSHIPQLCLDVWHSLRRVILGEIEHPRPIKPAEEVRLHIQPDEALDVEGLAHHKFAEERLRFFVGRTEMLAKIDNYLKGSGRRNLAIVGAGGTGKSALMARAIQQTQEANPKAEIVYRFIGASPGASDGRSLLDSLCHEISRRYGANAADIPTDYVELVPELGKRMQLASADRPLILFLDSLDQLSASQNARSLIWLPSELPEHVSVIVSTRPEDTLKAMEAKQSREETLGGLSHQEGDDLLSQWLASVHRTLQAAQRKEVLDKFVNSEGNPLYLKLAFEEARLWTSGQSPEQLAPEVKGIIEKNMISRLENEGSHGEAMVAHALGYLAASRHGLAEDELVDLLSRDVQVYEWFFMQSFHLPADLVDWAIQYRRSHPTREATERGQPPQDEESDALAWLRAIRNPSGNDTDFLSEVLAKADGPRLPVVLWSRLSFDLAPYLTERMVDGSLLLNFYHRELGDVARTIFLAKGKDKPYHEKLADYFRLKADPADDQSWTGKYLHGLSELPYHLTRAGQFEQVYQTLTDFKFLEHKAAEVGVLERKDEKGESVKTYTGVLQLEEDFELTLGTTGDRAPLIITAVDSGAGLSVYCPVCNKTSPTHKDTLNTEVTCPQEGCNTRLKLNPFVINRS